MYALRSSEGEFSSGTKVEIISEYGGSVEVKTVGKIQRYRTNSRWDKDFTKQIHTKIEDGPAKRIEFTTVDDNLVLLRERTR